MAIWEVNCSTSNVLAKDCGNVAAVSGRTSVGGICGEAQFGGYEVVNTGAVSATDNQSTLGGIVGNTSIAVIYNVVNQGTVTAAKAGVAPRQRGREVAQRLRGRAIAQADIFELDDRRHRPRHRMAPPGLSTGAMRRGQIRVKRMKAKVFAE